MKEFTQKEQEFLENIEECRIATSHDEIIHMKPVSFIFYKNSVYIATDYSTRSFKNLKINSKIAFVSDIYKHGDHKAVCVQGDSEIVEQGEEFLEIYDVFYKKFEWVRDDPWEETEAPFIKINPFNITSWGLK